MPAKINSKDVIWVLPPDLHGEDTEERQKDSGVDGRDGFFKSMDETDTDLFALSPVVPVSREADPPRQRRRISLDVENLGEDTAPFPDCDDPQFGG